MNSRIASLFYIHLLVGLAESYVVTPPPMSGSRQNSALSAYSHSSGGSTHNMHSTPWGSRGSSAGVPSRTAREGAVNIEWEPMSELDRRIEDGIHYEHRPNHYDSDSKAKRIDDAKDNDDSPPVRAVFCAYRYSEEDYNRLKSADVQ